jgi:HPt (histidine-containing phosphotransfer) domain-containing protein
MTSDPLEALRQRFVERARADADVLEQALLQGERLEMERLVHGLAGAAGLFGYRALSEQAVSLDAQFARRDPPDEAMLRDLIRAARAVT